MVPARTYGHLVPVKGRPQRRRLDCDSLKDKTFAEAKQICEKSRDGFFQLRLCTESEIMLMRQGAARGPGCGLDRTRVWTSTPGLDEITEKQIELAKAIEKTKEKEGTSAGDNAALVGRATNAAKKAADAAAGLAVKKGKLTQAQATAAGKKAEEAATRVATETIAEAVQNAADANAKGAKTKK